MTAAAPTGAACPVICLAGPTGAGKTALALTLARELGGEIINADSRQVYADFPLITAQPSPQERAQAAHHLYGFLPAGQKISAGRWAGMAAAKAREVWARGRVPLLVGGTGLYFQALLRGMAAIPAIPAEVTRRLAARLADSGPEALHAELSRRDPTYAARIHPRDRQRILRALEVLEGTGKPFSWWHGHAMSAPLCTGPLFVLDASLDWLVPRLARRLDAMLEAGAVEEARAALARTPAAAVGARLPGWSGIGCVELLDHLMGRTSLAECRARWLANTRAYAKRQLTWFR
ncbi:MAG: tRNA (adenosine(37)-N6)-dimethylallyltransferase MiaA, partial [Desulfovibrio sp.]|nr:tRNA (adenosine(37)-N6)-dimethylallyltransferase MiaA [Desulfovibrio sp.]